MVTGSPLRSISLFGKAVRPLTLPPNSFLFGAMVFNYAVRFFFTGSYQPSFRGALKKILNDCFILILVKIFAAVTYDEVSYYMNDMRHESLSTSGRP